MASLLPFFRRLVNWLSAFSYQLFGKFSWQSPPWLKIMRRELLTLLQRNFVRVLLMGVLLLTAAAGTYFYSQRVNLPLTMAQITPPIAQRDGLTIDFVVSKGTELSPLSAAPLEHAGQPIHSGIKMIPSQPGQWQWRSDSQLTFTPTDDWPAGQNYQIAFDNSVFNPRCKMKAYHESFSTPELGIELAELRLYQDLINPEFFKIIGTLKSNYPINDSSLRDSTRLIMQKVKNHRLDNSAEHIPLTITIDKHLQKAYIESAPLKLPAAPQFVNLMIGAGVEAIKGPSKSTTAIAQKLIIPDFNSFLQIKDVTAGIQRDRKDRPEQVLKIETTVGMNSEDLLKNLHAYILPRDYPATLVHPVRQDYPWSKPGEVTPEVLEKAMQIELHALPEEHPYPTVHRFKLEAQTPSDLYIEIAKGLSGAGGFCLASDFKAVVQTPVYPKELQFLHQGSLLSKSGQKKMTVAVRGIPEVKFTICQVLTHAVNHLVTQTRGNFQNPQFRNGSFGRESVSQMFSEFRQFDMGHPCEWNYTSIDLERYLAHTRSFGLFLLKAEGWEAKQNAPNGIEAERLVLITDMDLIVKDNVDGTHDIFVHTISEGLPVAGADVAILGRNSLPIITALTDANGHAALPALHDFKDDREPSAYVVRKGEDLSLMPYQRKDRALDYSRFDIGGVSDLPEGTLSAFLFSDRGIYRAGDHIHLAAVVKNRFAGIPTAGLPLEIVVTDPHGKPVLNQKIALPHTHFLSFDYNLPHHAPTGEYHVNLYVVKDHATTQSLGSSTLRVEEFLPDRMKIEAQFAQCAGQGWLSPHHQKAKISLSNLFGSPAANHKVKGKMLLTPKRALHFPHYASYRFVDPLPEPESTFYFSENFPDAASDSNGNVEFALNLERFSQATYQLEFLAEGFEAGGGRSVKTETSALVTPHKFLIGYQTAADLNFLKQNGKEKVRFIAINPELQPIALDQVQAKLIRISTVSALVKAPDGTYRYQSQQQRTTERSQPFTLGSEGNDFILPTDQVGDFALTLNDRDGSLLSEIFFSVVGNSDTSLLKNGELAVKLDKKVYRVGDTIELQIAAPYAGAGLLTIEQDKVYAYKWFKADSPTSVQTIAIPPDFQGNGYVNVALIRAWDSDDSYSNPLSYAILPFHISREEQTLHVDLIVPEFVRAGEELSIQYSTSQPAKIVLFAVDEGILRVDGYQAPDPLAFFFRKGALMVKTSQMADLILPKQSGKRESSAPGGDKQTKRTAMNFNPFKRKAEKPAVFWSGIVDSSAIPKTMKYRVPDSFNGSLRVMAVAVSQDKVGQAAKSTQAQSYFTIRPHAPSFMAPGDQAIVTASITNGLKDEDDSTPVIVDIAASPHLAIFGEPLEPIVLSPGQERQLAFQLKAEGELGEAALTVTAKQGNKESKITSTLSVRPPSPFQTHIISGYDDSATQTINSLRQLYPEHRLLEAAASANPLILAYGLQGYLDSYPYDCTEQLISRAFATLAIAKHPFFQLDPQMVQQKFKETIQILRERQLSCGGFSLWPALRGEGPSELVSVLTMDYLTEAKLSGYAIPEELFRQGMQFLEAFARKNVCSLSEARLQAHAIYVLTRNGMVTSNYLTNLQLYLTADQKEAWNKDLTCAYMAATHKLLQNIPEANRLIRGYQMEQIRPQDGVESSVLAGDAQFITLISRHFPDQLNAIRGESLMALVKGMAGERLNTRSAACSLQALSSFSPGKSGGNLAISEIHEDRSERPLVSSNALYLQANFNPEAKALRFQNPEKETYFFQVRQAGFDRNPSGQPIKNGLEIFREHRDLNGKPIQSTQLGNQIEARIAARTLNHSSLSNVAIVDLLPGGFEVDLQSVDRSCCDYVDVREDRIIFYCSLQPSATELSYRLQAVSKGEFAVPPIFAQAMDYPTMQAQGRPGKIAIQ